MEVDILEPLPKTFPQDAVVAALEAWWAQEQMDAILPGDATSDPDIMKPSVEIDSHRAVRALLTLQDVVKMEIPETVIKAGGYDSMEEMHDHLLPRVLAIFEVERKKQNATNQR